MSYQALYRRYRPKYFRDVVGQEHITTTLKNQVISGRVAHAYLFCGTRGTGKTSVARIFASAINCEHPVDGEPCYECAACRANLEGGLDIIEIDAASNTGVDDVRDLLEKVRFAPINGRYKVYIIDEVHMLSNSAFNALLKTLEEPPVHIVFILATTEPQKLLATILSRCQRYEFHRMTVENIVRRLQEVLEDSGAHFEEEGLLAIARAADGGMRDALSLADQCIAFCGEQVSTAQVLNVLGSMDQDFLFGIIDAILRSDGREVLFRLDELLQKGRDLGVFLRDIAAHFRNLLLIGACGDASSLIDCTKDTYERYRKQAQNCPAERALRAIDLLSEAENEMKWLTHPRALVEAALLRICRPEDEKTIEALLDRIDTLERRLASGEITVSPIAEQKKPSNAEADLPPWEEEPPPPSEEPPADPEESGPSSPVNRAEAIYQIILSAMTPNIQALAKLWSHQLKGNQFLFFATGMNDAVLKLLRQKIPDYQKAVEEKFPGIEIQFLSSATVEQPSGGFRKKAQQIFGVIDEMES